jgi:hypothetical protein
LTESGTTVQGLTSSSFVLSEDNNQRAFEISTQNVGIALVFAIDLSASMSTPDMPGNMTRLDTVREVIRTLLSDLDPERNDRVAVVGFADTVTPTLALTDDYGAVANAIELLPKPSGATALFDAVYQSLNLLAKDPATQPMRKGIFVFSDGADTRSSVSKEDVGRLARDVGATINTVGFGDPRHPDEAVYGPLVDKDLIALALLSGGEYRHYSPPADLGVPPGRATSKNDLIAQFRAFATQRIQYRITYRSRLNTSGTHQLRITSPKGPAHHLASLSKLSHQPWV